MAQEIKNYSCVKCGKPVVVNFSSGIVAHQDGGVVEQFCQNQSCGWKGGQYGRFSECPRCGDGTSLVDDHIASV